MSDQKASLFLNLVAENAELRQQLRAVADRCESVGVPLRDVI